MNKINPIIKADFPDPDVIRVEDTYYMLSTTKHFMPGAVILRSFDLKQWEIASYVFKTLDNTSEEKMEGEKSNYGHGMWAGSLRYHNGKFYVTFVARETEKTYLYTSENIEGPWKKQYIEGYYHASSLLFDEDRIFILYGYKDLWITELERDLSGPKLNGFTKMVASNIGDAYVHYEGAHFYKIDGRYYFFVNTWPKDGSVRRIQWCFMAHTLEDDFVGKIVIDHDRNFYNQGIAQGGIVDTPWGNWYGIFFQDHGAVGRIPILLPMQWENEFPKFQQGNELLPFSKIKSNRPYYQYEKIYTSDDFDESRLKIQWQWNHEPDPKYYRLLPGGGLCLKAKKISTNLIQAGNTLTQRMMWPKCESEVTIDAMRMKDGDVAGICALQGCYGLVGIVKELNTYYLIMMARELKDTSLHERSPDYMPGTVFEKISIENHQVRLKIVANFEEMRDYVEFYYYINGTWRKIGKRHQLYFKLDHFVGCRFGLFIYATKEIGGEANFHEFKYNYEET